jgi:hypothetical protein
MVLLPPDAPAAGPGALNVPLMEPVVPLQLGIAGPPGIGVAADLGDLPPIPDVPAVSVHYRETQDFVWGPGRDVHLITGGPGGRNHLLIPLINKEIATFKSEKYLLQMYRHLLTIFPFCYIFG